MEHAVAGHGTATPDECHAIIAMASSVRSGAKCPPKTAADYARRIVGCYRSRDWVDPEMFTMALVGLLASYPAAVVAMVADPVRGIPRQFKFPPSIAEVGDMLDTMRKRVDTAEFAAKQVLGLPPSGTAQQRAPAERLVASERVDGVVNETAKSRQVITDEK